MDVAALVNDDLKGIRMKLILLICAASFLFLSTGTANATPDLSHGNGLFSALSGCPPTSDSAFGKQNFSEGEFHDCLQAFGYIKGAVDVLRLTPDGVEYGQEFDIIYTYLKTHVNQRQRLSPGLIRDALLEAFQAKASTPAHK
jgi:hypothetical protein